MVCADVPLAALDGEADAVVGSFTADGLTYAIDGEGQVALVAVAPIEAQPDAADATDVTAAAEGAPAAAEGATDGFAPAALQLPASVSYDGADYALVRIAPLALRGCGATALFVPASVEAIDTAAALGCDTLAEVAVDPGNPNLSTFDGYLTDKAQTSILLVPEGRVGQLRIASTIQDLEPRAFSHCTRLSSLDVDAGCPGLASWNGSIYTADLATLLRVPAGAAELTLPPECAAIGASALSGCTALRSISVQGSVGSIAPSAFGEIEEVQALPADAVSADASASADAEPTSARPVQITGLVAVASSALSAAQVDKSAIQLTLAEGSDPSAWESAGFLVGNDGPSEGEGDEASAVGIAEPESSTPGTLAASIISEKRQLTPEEAPAASMQEAITYEADPSEPLYQRLLEKYKDDKFLDPDNGVTPESLAAGAYDALMKYGNQANAISPMYAGSAWWMFTEEDDGLLTLSIWCAAGGVIGQNAYVAWDAVRPYVERARMLKVGEKAPDGAVVATNNATLGSGPFNGQPGENVRACGMTRWFEKMTRLFDVDDVYLVTEYKGWVLDSAHGLNAFDHLFVNCKSLVETPSSWRVPEGAFPDSVTGWPIQNVFLGCDRLTIVNEGFSVQNTHAVHSLFENCPSLVSLPSSFALSAMTTYQQGKYNPENYFGTPFSLDADTGYSPSNLLATYWNGPESELNSKMTTTIWPKGVSNAKTLWRNYYSRDLKGRQANNALFFIPRADATGDESVPSWVAVDAEGQLSTEAEQGIARNADGTLARPADPISKRDSYGFVGWYKDPSYTELFDFKHDTVGDYACLWGKFEKGPYAITYLDGTDTNAEITSSAEVTVDPEFFLQPSYNYGERVVVDAVPVREGYEFLDWTIEGITGDEPQKQAVIPAGTTGDLVAVAHWKKMLERNYLITTADAAAGYTVDNFPVATGVSSPKAWWTLDDKGELYIYCEPGATIAQVNFAQWGAFSGSKDDVGAWGNQIVREAVKSVRMDKGVSIQEQGYSFNVEDANHNSYGIGMSAWFRWMPNLSDISGIFIPSGLTTLSCLFYGDWSLRTLDGAYGTFSIPEGVKNLNAAFAFSGLEELPDDFTIPSSVLSIRCAFQATQISDLSNEFTLPSTLKDLRAAFRECYRLKEIPASVDLTKYSASAGQECFIVSPNDPGAFYDPAQRNNYLDALVSGSLKTLYAGNLSRLYPGATGKTAAETKAYWLNTWNRELVGPEDLVAPQSAVRFQMPKADGSGYTTYDVLADASGRVTAPPVTKYGYSKVTWRYDTGTAGADLGHVAASGSCGQEGLSFDASALPSIKAGLKGPVYAEISGLMLSMDMPVGSGNLWYAIDCGEVTALGSSASTRAGMADAHELKFESYTPIPTQLTATFTANDAPDGTPAVEKLFPNGLDAGTGFALALDGGASQSAGFKAMVDAGGSAAYDELVELAASPSVQQPGQATGTLALKLGGTNDVDFEEETTNYSVADIVWTLDASAQYDFWVTDDAGIYSTAEIKAAADAISAYGTTDAVPAYRQYNRYLQQQSPDADPVLSVKVYDQGDGTASTHKVDVLGIAQDTKAIGGKAGLTFGWHDIYTLQPMNAAAPSTYTGWADSEMRAYLRETFYGSLPKVLQNNSPLASVRKRQQIYLQNGTASANITTDDIFLMSFYEVFGSGYGNYFTQETSANSFQYQYYQGFGIGTADNSARAKKLNGTTTPWWTRSQRVWGDNWKCYGLVTIDGGYNTSSNGSQYEHGVVPCFCF